MFKNHNTNLYVSLFHIIFVSSILFYASYCLKHNKRCFNGFSQMLLILGVSVFLYHLYKLLVNLNVIDPFNNGGYLGKPVETFVPFSFPYHKETDRYYSYHDNEHTRNCNCKHNTKCHTTTLCNTENFDTLSPVDNTDLVSGFN